MQLNSLFLEKATRNLNLKDYGKLSVPLEIAKKDYDIPFDRQYILRMMVRNPDTNGFQIPSEWSETDFIEEGTKQASIFLDFRRFLGAVLSEKK